jgi:hypothetical protein
MSLVHSRTRSPSWLSLREHKAAFGRALQLSSLLLALALSACGSEVPPNLPTTQAYQRMTPRIELVALIVSDSDRALKVKQLYEDIERVMLDVKKSHAEQLTALIGAKEKPLTDDEVRQMFRVVAESEKKALERYAALQVELRQQVTEEEFARLDALR